MVGIKVFYWTEIYEGDDVSVTYTEQHDIIVFLWYYTFYHRWMNGETRFHWKVLKSSEEKN